MGHLTAPAVGGGRFAVPALFVLFALPPAAAEPCVKENQQIISVIFKNVA